MWTRADIRLPALLLSALLLCVPVTTQGQEGTSFERALGSFEPSEASAHVRYLADDRMMGRNTPSPELDSAAEYIAGQLRSFGVEPVEGSYFHSYRVRREDLGRPTFLSVDGEPVALREEFVPFEFTSSESVEGEACFVGFGLSRPDLGYDDYEGVDVRGKVVLAVAGGPSGFLVDGITGAELDPGPREKMRWAEEHGAIGFLLVPSPLRSRLLRPSGYPWPSLFGTMGRDALPLQLDVPWPFRRLPSASISGPLAGRLLSMNSQDLTALVRRIDMTGMPESRSLRHVVSLGITLDVMIDSVRNVVGIIPGREQSEQAVIIGAHYDHVGHFQSIRQRGMVDADTIYNGADDNASGCAALLMNARAFASLPIEERPRRSIVLLFFCGEEKGLFGSRSWVSDPRLALSRTVAMLNMDMVGRNGRDSIRVGGRSRSADLSMIVERANRAEGMVMTSEPEEMFYRSDHASFASRGIPVLSFSSGPHSDYHKVGDEADKVDTLKVARVARLCFRAAWMIAESEEVPEYDGPRAPEPVLLSADDHDH